jgi:two-component system response regulator HydG
MSASVEQRLLIVDDEHSILVGMKRYFRSRGYVVDCASEKEQAKDLVDRLSYACVVADLHLTEAHEADGLDVVAYVRTRCPGTPVIVLTAYGSLSTEAEARRLGAATVLSKPQRMDRLAEIVAQVAGQER